MKRFKTVDDYIAGHPEWNEELQLLRDLVSSTELEETVKWGAPVYTINGKNVVGLGAFKSYVGLWFYQGVFLQDEHGFLINAQEGKTQAMRQWRFNALEEIQPDLIKAYLEEAIQNQKDGKEIKPKRNKELILPTELEEALEQNDLLKASFEAFTPGKKREFADYIREAKRESTRIKRLEKIMPMILQGVGLGDKYR